MKNFFSPGTLSLQWLNLVLGLTCFARAASGQVVADGSTNTITFPQSGIINGDLTVGTNGSRTLLRINGGGYITNTGDGYISRALGSTDNKVSVSGNLSRWVIAGSSLSVGRSGNRATLEILNGADVICNAGHLGNFPESSGNSGVVDGSGSLWRAAVELNVGLNGDGNTLIVTNSGSVQTPVFRIGRSLTSGGNLVRLEGGSIIATNISRSGSVDVARGALQVHRGLLETDFLWVTNGLPQGAEAPNEDFFLNGGTAIVRGGKLDDRLVVGHFGNTPAVLDVRAGYGLTAGRFTLGSNSANNRLWITNGGTLETAAAFLSEGTSSTGNVVVISGTNSTWRTSSLTIGGTGGQNQLWITNGGLLIGGGDIGRSQGSHGNLVVVSGVNSRWIRTNTSGDFLIGTGGSSNAVRVLDDAVVDANSVFLGSHAGGTNNSVIVDGGELRLIRSTSGQMVVRGGKVELHSGRISAGPLWLTNGANSTFEFLSGTFECERIVASNGVPFVVGDGLREARLEQLDQFDRGSGFQHGLVLRDQATFEGRGSIRGNILLESGSTFAPFPDPTPFHVQGNVTMSAGSTVLLVATPDGIRSWLRCNVPLSFAGRLVVTNAETNPFSEGGTVQLFDAPAYAGMFDEVLLPPLGPGLMWQNRLAVDGTIAVQRAIPGDRYWTNAAGGSLSYAPNWLNWLSPAAGDRAWFTNVASYAVDVMLPAVMNAVYIDGNGSSSSPTFGVYSTPWQVQDRFVIGLTAGRRGRATLNHGTLVVTNTAGTGTLVAGQDGAGLFTLDGGTLETDWLLVTNLASSGSFPNSSILLLGGSLLTRRGSWIRREFDLALGGSATTPFTWDVLGGTNVVEVGARSAIRFGISAGRRSVVRVLGTGTRFESVGSIEIGSSTGASSNELVVAQGALVRSTSGFVGGRTNGAQNSAWIEGTGSVWEAGETLNVGAGGSQNQVVLTNGAKLFATNGWIGLGAASRSNQITVTDAGTALHLESSLNVGGDGSLNLLRIQRDGTVVAPSVLVPSLGSNQASNNSVVVDGGNLHATNAAQTGVIQLSGSARPALLKMILGLVETDQLGVQGSHARVEFDSGTLRTRSLTHSNGSPMDVGNNSSAATLELLGGGISTVSFGLVIRGGSLLTGDGTIIGNVTNHSGGTLAPGVGLGQIEIQGALHLDSQSTTRLQLDAASGDHDRLVCAQLRQGGTLTIENLNGVLSPGDRFELIQATSRSGGFDTVALPPLSAGLGWTNRLAIDGSIEVITVPAGDRFWLGATTGVYQEGARWTPQFVPTVADTAWFLSNGVSRIEWLSDATVARAVFAGSRATNILAPGVRAWNVRDRLEVSGFPGIPRHLVFTNGQVLVTNATGTAIMMVTNASVRWTGGELTADELRVEGVGAQVLLDAAGELRVRSLSHRTGAELVVGASSLPRNARVYLADNSNHVLAGGIQVRAGGRLDAGGNLAGNLRMSGGVLDIGADRIATVRVDGNVNLSMSSSVCFMELDAALETNDVLSATGTITYRGRLQLDSRGGTLRRGQRFKLFDASAYSGTFNVLDLPPLEPGLIWSNRLSIDGTLEVFDPPAADRFWINNTGGSFFTANNWSGGFVPVLDDTAIFTNNNSFAISLGGDAFTAGAAIRSGTGVLTQQFGGNGWTVTNRYQIDRASAAGGVIHQTGALRVTNKHGTAELDLRSGFLRLNGGVIEADRLLVSSNENGALTLAGGHLITRGGSIAESLSIGADNSPARPLLEVRAGGTLSTTNLALGATNASGHLRISGGGILRTHAAIMGGVDGSSDNLIEVTGAGSRLEVTSTTLGPATFSLYAALSTSTNVIHVSDGGHVSGPGIAFLRPPGPVSDDITSANRVIVEGAGSTMLLGGYMRFLTHGIPDELIVRDGGSVTIGSILRLNNGYAPTAHDRVVVSGTGSILTIQSNSLTPAGFIASGEFNLWNTNRIEIRVEDGGFLEASSMILGPNGPCLDCAADINSGSLILTNRSRTGGLTNRSATLTLRAGLIEADYFSTTASTNARFRFHGGTVRTRGTTNSFGAFNVGDGLSSATLQLTGEGRHDFPGGVRVQPHGMITGGGIIFGNVINLAGATLNPGEPVGALTIRGHLSLASGSTNIFEIDKFNAIHDRIQGVTNLVFGGVLHIRSVSTPLSAGDAFQLYNALNYSGAIEAILPAEPGPGLAWDARTLATNGILRVVQQPSLIALSIAPNGSLTLAAANGSPNSVVYLRSTTNLDLPAGQWPILSTNSFNAQGLLNLNHPVSTNDPGRYFRLEVQ